jgi:hypothetical protein
MLTMPTNALTLNLSSAAFIMDDLGLSQIAHSLIGDHNGSQGAISSSKCISGGQRRRLSIALELLSSPSALLLDEVSGCMPVMLRLFDVNFLSAAYIWFGRCIDIEDREILAKNEQFIQHHCLFNYSPAQSRGTDLVCSFHRFILNLSFVRCSICLIA